MSTHEDHRQSDRKKVQGNEAMQEKSYEEAIKLYTEAIELNPTNAILWSNRSLAHIKMEEYATAIEDATRCIELDPSNLKGYYRRGSANMGLLNYVDALKDFKTVAERVPKDPENSKKIQECEKLIQESEIEDAIHADRLAHPQHIDTSTIEIDDGYYGPRLGKDGITIQFLLDLMAHQKSEKNLHRKYLIEILETVKDILEKQPSLVEITIPEGGRFTVCGDVHGQYYDLLNIFEENGLPSESNPYLFNGDFVDRGSFSVEVITLLLAFKLLYPDHFHLARGNHESMSMTRMYGFEGEVRHKYDYDVYELFLAVFCVLPLAHVLNGKIFVVHGGLPSSDTVTLEDINNLHRNQEPPLEGVMCDLLWSDPQPLPGRSRSKRGVGVNFGPDVTKSFLERNNLEMVVRSHEVKHDGYQVEADGKLVTVFSAPNYCDQMGNRGAYIIFDHECNPAYHTFEAVPHPSVPAMKYSYIYRMFGL